MCTPGTQVALLFRNHKDLLEEFTYFLPDAQAPAQVCLPHLGISAPHAGEDTALEKTERTVREWHAALFLY